MKEGASNVIIVAIGITVAMVILIPLAGWIKSKVTSAVS
jgi:hypothetical protein